MSGSEGRKRLLLMTEDERNFFAQLGARIAELRQAQGMTQTELADDLDVSQQTVASFEKGRRRVPVSLLPSLTEILDTPIETLIEGKKPASKRGPASRLEKQIEEIRKLSRAKQRFVMEMLDAVIAQARQQNTQDRRGKSA